jgi:hypothetical protein
MIGNREVRTHPHPELDRGIAHLALDPRKKGGNMESSGFANVARTK